MANIGASKSDLTEDFVNIMSGILEHLHINGIAAVYVLQSEINGFEATHSAREVDKTRPQDSSLKFG
jgi:hypothetical protein